MAQVKISPSITVVKPVVEKPEEIILTLSREEAEAIKCLTGMIGGDRDHSFRKLVDNIWNALNDNGIQHTWSNKGPWLSTYDFSEK